MRLKSVVNYALGAALLLTVSLPPDASAQASARARQVPGGQSRPPATPPSHATQGARATAPGPQTPRGAEADPSADLSITARVTADSLRFEKVLNPRVEFTGRQKRDTVWEAERQNLPPEVRPGVTYRDVGITLRITSVFADIERIVAEALGEVPPSEDAPAAPPAATPPATPDPARAAATTTRRRRARAGRAN